VQLRTGGGNASGSVESGKGGRLCPIRKSAGTTEKVGNGVREKRKFLCVWGKAYIGREGGPWFRRKGPLSPQGESREGRDLRLAMARELMNGKKVPSQRRAVHREEDEKPFTKRSSLKRCHRRPMQTSPEGDLVRESMCRRPKKLS